MNQIVDGLLAIVASLNAADRKEFVDRLISSGILKEDVEDVLVIASRRDEPTARYREFRRRVVRNRRR